MNSRQRTLGHAAALMTILIWGTTFVSTKVLLRDFTPVTVLFTRFVIGYAFLWCLRPRLLPLSGWKRNSCSRERASPASPCTSCWKTSP